MNETGVPMKVQQELMRHADIRTTMNVYREGHGREKTRSTRQGRAHGVGRENGLVPLVPLGNSHK